MSNDRMAEPATPWKRYRLVVIVVLAAIIGLGILLTSVLHAYSQLHYDYLTGAPAASRQAGLT
jgi:hypothetical protein